MKHHTQKTRVFVEAADPNVVDARGIMLWEMTTAKSSSQWVSKSVERAMRHNDAANDNQKRSSEFRILLLCYQ